MHGAMRRRRRIGEIPIDEHGQPIAEISLVPTELEIAAQRERDAMLAARVGMPPVGATATSKAGIIWKVDGHTHASCLTTQGQDNSELTLYPVVFPQNLSAKLTEFLLEVARCTPKSILPLDTLPHQFPRRAHPGGHSVDSISDRYRILIFLDGSDASEAVIAHELAHVWIELVHGIEDYRVMRDTSDSGRYSQVQFLQSFVLDVAVDRVLNEKGFDTSGIEIDKQAALAQLGQAASAGYQSPTKREAVYMASFLASSMLEETSSDVLCLQTSQLVENRLPEVFRLANLFKEAVQNSPPKCSASAKRAIDEVLTAAFEYTDGGINLDTELFELKPEPCWDQDKNPDWLPGVSVKGKCEVGIAMARHGATSEAAALFERTENGVRVRFQTPEGVLTPYTQLEHVDTIPESPEARMRRIIEINEMNRRRIDEMAQGPGMPGGQPPGPQLPPGFPPMPGRSYSPGLARFLTAVRLQELLGGEHPYGYANSNPIVYVDPSGHSPCGSHKCWTYPGGPCAYAASIGDDEGDSGGVVCCEGKKFACAWNTTPTTPPGFITCVKEHEITHFNDGDCPPTGYVRQRFREPKDEYPEECRAYAWEIGCLNKHRRVDCKGTSAATCDKLYKDRICAICHVMKRVYGCKTLPSNCKYC